MAYDRQYLQITAQGTLGGSSLGADIFSWGIKASGPADFDAAAALEDLDIAALAAAFRAYHINPDMGIHVSCELASIKVSAVGVTGNYLEDVDPRIAPSRPSDVVSNGGSSAARHPNQVCMVVSLRSTGNLGLATKGRFYLPLPTYAITDEGYANVSVNAATISADFINSVNDVTNTGDNPAVVQIMSKVGVGRSRAVSNVRVGNVLDTQRSRRNALTEIYSIAPVDAP